MVESDRKLPPRGKSNLTRYEPGRISLCFIGLFSERTPSNFINPTSILTTPLILVFNHAPGFEINTKNKEAIRQLYNFREKLTAELIEYYKLNKSTIYYVLIYNTLK